MQEVNGIGPRETVQGIDGPRREDDTRMYRRRARLESMLIVLAGLLVVGAGVFGLWIFATGSIRENYRHYLVTLARAAALQVDAGRHAAILDRAQGNSAEYESLVLPLRRMRTASADIRYIYTAVLDNGQIRFVLDAAEPGDHDGDGVNDHAGVWELYENPDPAMLAALQGQSQGDAASTTEPFEDKWGSFMTGYAPIVDADGRQTGVLGVDVNASVYLARMASARHWALLGLLPSMLLVCLLAWIYYRQRVRELDASRSLQFEQQRLSDSEQIFRSLFELSPVGIALNDLATGRFLQANDALVRSSGHSHQELLQKTFWDITPADYSAAEREQLDTIEKTRHYGPYEKEYLRRDGSRYPVLLSGISLTDPQGRDVVWSIVQDISQLKAVERELATAARHDKLTGLANRTQFMEALQQLVRSRGNGDAQLFAVLFLDFDRFKLINDTLGHEAGDTLLREAAARLRDTLREDDAESGSRGRTLIARFGGDEFLVLASGLRDQAAAESVAVRLLEALAPAYSIMGRDVHSTASIGIVTSEKSLDSADSIVRNADVAMYEAKRAGRACYVLFNESMHVRLTRHVTLEADLRKALGTPHLNLVYQPIVELESGCTVSVEALLRWRHPELGDVSPAEFIPIAEESGLIVVLGHWVLLESCRMLADWRAREPQAAPECVSVNVSRTELALGQRLLARVQEALASTGLPAECLQLEVTEREVMRDPRASLRLMQDLRKLGVRLAMDDFGTGTSSLGCLRDYPFDAIKIDRSFVHDLAANPDVLALIHATITLADNLGKGSVAEGVETAAQVAVLQSLGCRYAQGHFFSLPLSAGQLVGCAAPPAEIAATAGR